MAVEKIPVPDIGDSQDVEVIEILVNVGDEVSENDSLLVLESDKAAMEIPSPSAGVIKDILVKVGDQVSEGADIIAIETEAAEQASEEEEPASKAETADESTSQSADEGDESETAGSSEQEAAAAQENNVSDADGGTSEASAMNVTVPDLGDDSEVEVIDILVAVGDEISEEDGIVTLESDKAAMDVPSPASGKVLDIKVSVGDKVSEGSLLLELETTASTQDDIPVLQERAESSSEAAQNQEAASDPKEDEAAPGSTSVEEIKVPDLGGENDVDVIDILVTVGDEVSEEQGLITLETDKAAMDVPSPKAGKVVAVKVKEGDKVNEGTAIVDLEVVSAAKSSTPAKNEEKPATQPQAQSGKPEAEVAATQPAQDQEVKSNGEVYAGPAVRKLARELGVNLAEVKGSGAKGRIVKEDVQGFVKTRMQSPQQAAGTGTGVPAIADIDFSKFGEIEEVDMSKLHQVTARNMSSNWLNVPHVTQFDEADVTDLEEFRAAQKPLAEKKGIKLTPLPFIVKACAHALKEYPQFNVSLHSSGTKLIQKKYVNIGVAVATPAGLMVPVVKDADKKSIWDIASEIAELGAKAKDRKLSREDMQGACFTVSSLGNMGGMGFTPIVNSPEVAILGVSRTAIKPVYRDNQFVPRKMLPYSLSYDHRAVNGLDGGLFCSFLGTLLSDIRLLAL